MTDIQKEITTLEEEMATAFNCKDIERILTFFESETVGFSSTTHERIQGRDALRKTFEYYLQEGEKVEYSISNVLVRK